MSKNNLRKIIRGIRPLRSMDPPTLDPLLTQFRNQPNHLSDCGTNRNKTFDAAATYLDVQLKFVKVEAVIDTNICETCSDTNLFPFKLTSNVPLDCWPYDHLHYFTEYVALAVLRQNYLGCGKDTYKYRKSKITFLLRLILEIEGKIYTSSLRVYLEKSYESEVRNEITISKYVHH